MSLKRILLLAVVLAAAGADVLFYGGSRRVAKASEQTDPAVRQGILAGEQDYVGLNARLYRDLPPSRPR